MVVAQDADTVGKDLLVQGDGLGEAPRRLVCACEVVARGEGVAVVWSQEFPDDVHCLIEGECFEGKPKVMRVSKSLVQSFSDRFKCK